MSLCYIGYVFSYPVRGANKKFKDYVLDQNGYRSIGNGFKIKSRLYPREISVTAKSGKKMKKRVDEKQVIFYSEKYAQKAKADRAPALKKAKNLIRTPSSSGNEKEDAKIMSEKMIDTEQIWSTSLREEHMEDVDLFKCSEIQVEKFLKEEALKLEKHNACKTHLYYYQDKLFG